MQLTLKKDLNNFVFANNSDKIEIVYHPAESDVKVKFKAILKFNIHSMINTFYTHGNLVFKFSTDSWNHTLELRKMTFPLYNKDRYGMPNNIGTIAPNGTWIDPQILINCIKASTVGDKYHISYVENGGTIYISIEAKEYGTSYNLDIQALMNSNNQWANGEYQVLATAYSPAIEPNVKIWVRILMPDGRGNFKEVYTNFTNIGKKIDAQGKILYAFEGIPFVLRNFLNFNPIIDPYAIIRDNYMSTDFKIEYWAEYNGTMDYVYEDVLDTKSVLLAGIPSHFEDTNGVRISGNFILNNTVGNIGSKLNIISLQQPAWFSCYMPKFDDQAVIHIVYRNRENGIIKRIVLDESNDSLYRGLVHIPVWLYFDKNWIDNEALASVSFEIEASDYGQSDFPLMQYYIDYSSNENERWYYFVNSIGGIDSVRLYANKGEIMQLQSNEFSVANYKNQTENFKTTYNNKMAVNTENIDKVLKDTLIDMTLSRWIYEVDRDTIWETKELPKYTDTWNMEYTMERYAQWYMISRQILITSKDFATVENSASLFASKLEYKYSNEEQSFFTPYGHFNKLGKEILIQNEYIDINLSNVFSNQTLQVECVGLNIECEINGKNIGVLTAGDNNVHGLKTFNIPLIMQPNLTNYVLRIKGYLMLIIEVSGECEAELLGFSVPYIKSFSYLFNKIQRNDIIKFIGKYAKNQNIYVEMPNHKSLALEDVLFSIYKSTDKHSKAIFDLNNTPAVGLSGISSELKGMIQSRSSQIQITTD
jgi:hypothetical protein